MSRLKPGQVAVGVQQRSEACRSSAQKRIDALNALLEDDGGCAADLHHFKTIGALCDWSNPERGIKRISPKTLRAHIKVAYSGGYDDFIRDVKTAINRKGVTKPPRDEPRTDLRADAVLEMVQRYQDIVEKMDQIARSYEPVRRKLTEHFQKFGDTPREPVSKVIFASFGKSHNW